MKKIGIIGGSFDPVHFGHLLLAEQARDFVSLEQVIFIPAKVSPFKLKSPPADSHHRYKMTELAIKGNPGFSISDIEINSEKVSYTYKTLEKLQEIFGEDASLFFIVGTDSFLTMRDWMEAERIFENFSIIVGYRPRYKDKLLDKMAGYLRENFNTEIIKVRMPKIDISSSNIKKRIKKSRSIRYMMPNSVTEYIYEHRLYR